MHDDEGTDFYEIWQLQQGQEPGVDFMAAQQPLFLLLGKTILDRFGHNPTPLRLAGAIQVLLGAGVLALVVRKLWGNIVAILTLSLTLGSGMVYEQARLFRPDPMMLAWEMMGLAAVLLAVAQSRRKWWAAAGLCYGVSVLWKPFGLFPVLGLVFYFLYSLVNKPAHWRETIMDGVYFAVPFLLVGLGVSFLLYDRLGFYYGLVFEQHLGLERESSFLFRLGVTSRAYAYFFLVNSIFVFILPLRWLNKAAGRLRHLEFDILLAQLVSPMIFLLMTRPMHLRYFFYLTPVLAILLAWQIQQAFTKISSGQPAFSRFVAVVMLVIISFAALATRPSIPNLLTRRESGTLTLSNLVAAHTRPDEVVLSDYAGINFFARRPSIYEASIIAGGRIGGGIVTTDLLIDRIEADDVALVLVHVAGGEPPPHQLAKLPDYDRFRKYLLQKFELLTVFDRAGQQVEVYERR